MSLTLPTILVNCFCQAAACIALSITNTSVDAFVLHSEPDPFEDVEERATLGFLC